MNPNPTTPPPTLFILSLSADEVDILMQALRMHARQSALVRAAFAQPGLMKDMSPAETAGILASIQAVDTKVYSMHARLDEAKHAVAEHYSGIETAELMATLTSKSLL